MHLTSSPIDWYAARAGGIVAYVLLSVNVGLGLAMTGKKTMKHWPRFALEDVHRFTGLLAGTFVVVHIDGRRDRRLPAVLARVARRSAAGFVPPDLDRSRDRRRRATVGPGVHEPLPQRRS